MSEPWGTGRQHSSSAWQPTHIAACGIANQRVQPSFAALQCKAVPVRSNLGKEMIGACMVSGRPRSGKRGEYQAESGHVGDGLREEGLQVWKRMLLEQQAAPKVHWLG